MRTKPKSAKPDAMQSAIPQVFRLAALMAALCACAPAQQVTMSDLSRARERFARAKGLNESERKDISRIYDNAAQSLQDQIRWQALQVGHARTKAAVESEIAAARATTDRPLAGPPPAPPSETASDVDEEMARVRSDRASRTRLRAELSKLESSLASRADAIAARRAAIRENLQSIDDEMSVLALASASPAWEQASRISLQARRQSLQQEYEALGTERGALDLRRQLIPLQREAHLLRLEAYDQYLADLEGRRARARARDGEKSMKEAIAQAQQLARGYPRLSALAGDISQRAAQLWGSNGLEPTVEKTKAESEQLRASVARLQDLKANTVRRYLNSGLFAPATEWWPAEASRLAKPAEVAFLAVSYAANEAVARRQLFRLEEERNTAPAFETELQQFLAAGGKQTTEPDYADFSSRLRSMLQLRRSIAAQSLASTRSYVGRLGEARQAANDLLAASRDLQSFVLQRVLLARSVTVPSASLPSACVAALLWFVSAANWSAISQGFMAAGVVRNLLWIAGLLPIIALFLLRGRIAAWCAALKSPDQNSRRSLFFSAVAVLLSASPAPLAIFYAGWVIGEAGAKSDLGRAIAAGAAHCARFLYVVFLLQRMLASGGAADRLFGWPQAARDRISAAIRALTFIFVPLWFVASGLAEEGMRYDADPALQSNHNSLGRLCFIAAVFSFMLVGRAVLKRRGAVAEALGSGFDSLGFSRARVARVLLNVVLVSALVLSIIGFYVTAYLLVRNVVATVIWTLVLMLASALMLRRRIDHEPAVAAPRLSEQEQRARDADVQLRRLSRFGFTLVWFAGSLVVWSAALPSLRLLEKVQLLPEFKIAIDNSAGAATPTAAAQGPGAGKAESASATPAMVPAPPPAKPAQPSQARQPLYLSGALLAVLVAVLGTTLVRNIPGILRFTLFKRHKFDVGGEYAVSTIARYVVTMAGILVVSNILGLRWSSIQWLAAALTFGIGFGLQEIFANFAAGVILLFDRSIRVGDAVTVGNLSGIVARIRMRATTVTLWDRSDMVVPNKEFITTKLVNWALSNPETRVDVKVGVDYRSDVEQVREVLLRIAQAHPAVLKDPEPQVLLTQFADSAILFELRLFCMYAYGRPVLLDELHRKVLTEFREAGIVIAFPQIDVHLNTSHAQLEAKPKHFVAET